MKQVRDVSLHAAAPRIGVRELKSIQVVPSLAEEVRAGLGATPKTLPCRYFYDDKGSKLFECICKTPEYYPWRMEHALLARFGSEIMERAMPDQIVELGSGASTKTCRLLDACREVGVAPLYRPVDVCGPMVQDAALQLARRYPWLQIEGLVGDYLAALQDVTAHDDRALFVFLGGTIGNFNDLELARFAHALHQAMGPEDRLLLGVDLIKDAACLDAAYNDAAGYTRAFNLNILKVLNTRLGAQFRLAAFRHRAFFNAPQARIEMHLVAQQAQEVVVRALGRAFAFAEGETIRTEISRKFHPDRIGTQFRDLGFMLEQQWVSEEPRFCLLLLRRAGVHATQ